MTGVWVRYGEAAAGALASLGVALLSPEGLLSRHLLPRFRELSPEARSSVLLYVRGAWAGGLRGVADVAAALRATAFVPSALEPDGVGSLHRPAELLDPANAILNGVFRARRYLFPAEEYCRPEWLTVLRDVGLRSEVGSA